MEIPFNLLILPFLGGYIFVRFWNHSRVHTIRSDKERIFVRCSLAGFAALIIAWISAVIGERIFPCSAYSFCIPTIWNEAVPFENSGIAFAAFVIASTAWFPLNKWKGSNLPILRRIPSFDREVQINRAISEDADAFEMMLKRSKDEGLALAITMTNEKVYIGKVVHPFNPATPTKNIGLLPLQSGYRDPRTKRMYLTVDYSLTMQAITEELDAAANQIDELQIKRSAYIDEGLPAKAVSLDEALSEAKATFERLECIIGLFSLVVPVDKIASTHIFDSEVHAKYFR